jgi:AcrR family transcriptional regulator
MTHTESRESGMRPERRRATATHSAADRETRRQILDAAEALFIERGFKGVSMKDVADAVEITAAALYYHFPNGKEELFAETIRHFFEQTMERAFLAIEGVSDFRERLTLITRNVLTMPMDRLAPLLRDAHEYLKGRKPGFGRDIARSFSERMAGIFQAAIDAGEIGAEVPAELLVTFHQGMCIALLNRRRFREEAPADPLAPGEEERLAAVLVATLLDGVSHMPSTA